jgi:hypothetical protein
MLSYKTTVPRVPIVSSVTFKEEIEALEKNKAELLATAAGQFVLIKDSKIIGTFHSREDAIREGYKQVGNVDFFVTRIVDIEPAANFTSNLIAV